MKKHIATIMTTFTFMALMGIRIGVTTYMSMIIRTWTITHTNTTTRTNMAMIMSIRTTMTMAIRHGVIFCGC